MLTILTIVQLLSSEVTRPGSSTELMVARNSCLHSDGSFDDVFVYSCTLYTHTPDLAPERHFLNTPLIISSLSDLEGQFPPGVVRSTFQISQRSF